MHHFFSLLAFSYFSVSTLLQWIIAFCVCVISGKPYVHDIAHVLGYCDCHDLRISEANWYAKRTFNSLEKIENNHRVFQSEIDFFRFISGRDANSPHQAQNTNVVLFITLSIISANYLHFQLTHVCNISQWNPNKSEVWRF